MLFFTVLIFRPEVIQSKVFFINQE
jgi:hypothetical protein